MADPTEHKQPPRIVESKALSATRSTHLRPRAHARSATPNAVPDNENTTFRGTAPLFEAASQMGVLLSRKVEARYRLRPIKGKQGATCTSAAP